MFEHEAGTSSETRRRLLDAAGEVFADNGFARATVREICEKAGANIAAVNYHFGDKQKLYAAVFAYSHPISGDTIDQIERSDLPPEQELREFILQFLRRLLDPGRPSWQGRLMAREMAEPTGVLETFVEDEIRPRQAILLRIIAGIAGDLPPRVAARCTLSIVGQMLHYHFARPVLKRFSQPFGDLDRPIEELADHITQFSIGGIRAAADRYRKGSS